MTQTHLETGFMREAKLRRALFRGGELWLGNPSYEQAARTILEELVRSDIGGGDLTVAALDLEREATRGRILAREPGVVAGIEECSWLLRRSWVEVTPQKKDGDSIASGDTIMEVAGPRGALLASERVALNLLQRMSGIATEARRLEERVTRRNPGTHVVATRKTPWGLLDKRAVHLGGAGTHRLSLTDAILVKNNHLALLAVDEAVAVRVAVQRIWPFRHRVAFLEIEVRGKQAALTAAQMFCECQEEDAACPCLVMLDNIPPAEGGRILEQLRRDDLLEHVLIEASGNISEDNLEAYADCGVDAISIGALTHSPRALDICQRLS
jgi:nicotinate-nucleotide pyrophosphorylase (carboxylating)